MGLGLRGGGSVLTASNRGYQSERHDPSDEWLCAVAYEQGKREGLAVARWRDDNLEPLAREIGARRDAEAAQERPTASS